MENKRNRLISNPNLKNIKFTTGNENIKKERTEKEYNKTIRKEYYCTAFKNLSLCSWYRKDKSACGSCSCKVDA